MKHAQYLRERAADFRNMAVTVHNARIAQCFYHLAIACEEAAGDVERSLGNKYEATDHLVIG